MPVAEGDDVSSLPVEHIDLSGLTYEFDGETRTIEEFVSTTRTDGVVFVKDGTVVVAAGPDRRLHPRARRHGVGGGHDRGPADRATCDDGSPDVPERSGPLPATGGAAAVLGATVMFAALATR